MERDDIQKREDAGEKGKNSRNDVEVYEKKNVSIYRSPPVIGRVP